MPRGLGLSGAPLGSHLIAGNSVRSPRSLWKEDRKRRRSVSELALQAGSGEGHGGAVAACTSLLPELFSPLGLF